MTADSSAGRATTSASSTSLSRISPSASANAWRSASWPVGALGVRMPIPSLPKNTVPLTSCRYCRSTCTWFAAEQPPAIRANSAVPMEKHFVDTGIIISGPNIAYRRLQSGAMSAVVCRMPRPMRCAEPLILSRGTDRCRKFYRLLSESPGIRQRPETRRAGPRCAPARVPLAQGSGVDVPDTGCTPRPRCRALRESMLRPSTAEENIIAA